MADLDAARHAKASLRTALAGRDGVQAVGISHTDDGYGVRVSLRTEADRDGVPSSVEGVPVDVRVSGRITAGG